MTRGFSGKPSREEGLDLEIEHTSLKTDTRRNSTKKNEEYNRFNAEANMVSDANLVADEEAGLFEDQLRQRVQNERKKKEAAILEDLHNNTGSLAREEESLQEQLLREHKQFLKDENKMHAKMRKESKDSTESQISPRSATILPTVNLYDISSHRPISAVEFRYSCVIIMF